MPLAKERMPFHRSLDTPNTKGDNKNAAAMAWVEQWEATPEEGFPHDWDAREERLTTHPIW
jgi:hypothetical protein